MKNNKIKIAGVIKTENVREIVPTAPTVKIFIAAGKVQIVEAITEKQNVVKLCGRICKDPRARGTSKGIHITDIMIAVKGKKNVSFIPCICWQNVADAAGKLKKGTYVEVEGRFQSREYKRAIEGSAPYLMTAYEVSVAQLGVAEDDAEQKDE